MAKPQYLYISLALKSNWNEITASVDRNFVFIKILNDEKIHMIKIYYYNAHYNGLSWGTRIRIFCIPTIYKINNKDLLYSTGYCIQYLVIIFNGKESEKKICKNESLCYTLETNTILQINYTSIKIKKKDCFVLQTLES